MDKIAFEGLSFDDVLLLPGYSEYPLSELKVETKLTKEIQLKIPFVSANMDTVTEWELAAALAREGGIGIVHRSMTSDEQAQHIFKVKYTDHFGFDNAVCDKRNRLLVGASVGTSRDVTDRVETLVSAGVDIISVDVSNGYSLQVLKAIERIKAKFPDLPLIGGNVATPEAVRALSSAGADCIKVGMGPGAICTTRTVAGTGVPQLTAILNCAEAADECGVTVIADGGIRFSGDVAKALAAGANSVMLGSLFAGTKESPGQSITNMGKQYKPYRGMGSKAVMVRSGGDRHFQPGSKLYVPEGAEGMVPYVGTVAEVVSQMVGGLIAAMGYSGAKDIDALRTGSRFVRVTGACHPKNLPYTLSLTND